MFLKQRKHRLQNASIRSIIFMYFTITALAASVLSECPLWTAVRADVLCPSGGKSHSYQSVRPDHGLLPASGNETFRLPVLRRDQNADLSDGSINGEITLLYDNNKDNVENIALFSKEGELLESVPAARLKTMPRWQIRTGLRRHWKNRKSSFSMPHVQHIFDTGDSQYRWVVSVARAVEITDGPYTDQGVLLIDLRYNSLEQLFDGMNLAKGGYVYLTDSNGDLIYHPNGQLISSGLAMENNDNTAILRDGNYQEQWQGQTRVVSIKTVGYTGWKIVGVMPLDTVSLNAIKTRILIVFIIALVLFILTIINSYISSRITDPIKELEKSVNQIEEGNLETEVYTGGSYEIQHLGKSIQNMARQIKRLMDDIVAEHESKRKSEFDTLQSQINPHFLYNTLDIIVWMIENEKQSEAVKAVTALARFFRISLSKGKSIIPVRDELEHVRNYLMIQHMRYKNKFSYSIEAEDEVLGLASLKLILQPMVENAIYHGMEFMDGDGEIKIRAWKENNDLYLSVEDNGLGMTEEQVERLFTDTSHVPSRRGSGIGVKNVNERIHLYFGKDYGLSINSEPDEGTTVLMHLPAVSYEEIAKEEALKEQNAKKEEKHA